MEAVRNLITNTERGIVNVIHTFISSPRIIDLINFWLTNFLIPLNSTFCIELQRMEFKYVHTYISWL